MTLKKSFTKTTNYVMMMGDFYAYVHRSGGPTAAESHTKSQHLNPFSLSKILWTICEFVLQYLLKVAGFSSLTQCTEP